MQPGCLMNGDEWSLLLSQKRCVQQQNDGCGLRQLPVAMPRKVQRTRGLAGNPNPLSPGSLCYSGKAGVVFPWKWASNLGSAADARQGLLVGWKDGYCLTQCGSLQAPDRSPCAACAQMLERMP